jgi:hypothetical protein
MYRITDIGFEKLTPFREEIIFADSRFESRLRAGDLNESRISNFEFELFIPFSASSSQPRRSCSIGTLSVRLDVENRVPSSISMPRK